MLPIDISKICALMFVFVAQATGTASLPLRKAATSSKQRAEPLLAEALIVGEDVREAASVHEGHETAVGETVPLVRLALAVSEPARNESWV